MSNPLRRAATVTLTLSVAVLLSSLLVAGCNPVAWWANMRTPEIYVPDDSAVQLRGAQRVAVWAHAKDGSIVRGYVMAEDRWLICPPGAVVPTEAPKVAPTSNDDRKFAEIK